MMPQSIYYSLPPMPWFGMDIGGTLVKLVYFEPTDLNDINNGIKRNKADMKTMANIRRYLITNKAYGKSGHRDDHLQMSNIHIGGRLGTLHFIRFPTSQVSVYELQLASGPKSKQIRVALALPGGASALYFIVLIFADNNKRAGH